MTVAEAIEYKQSVSLEWEFVNTLRSSINSVETQISNTNAKIDKEITNKEEIVLGSDKERTMEDEAVIKVIRDEADKNRPKSIYPTISNLIATDFIDKEVSRIEDFESNIDLKLTTSNVTTTITVEW